MLPLDAALFEAINATAASPRGVIALASFLSLQLPLVLAGVMAGAALAGSHENRQLVLRAIAGLLLAWLLTHLLRAGLQVPRPAALGLGTQWIPHGVGSGFPSMHTAGAFAVAASLLFGRRAWLAAVAFSVAAAIGWSRIYLGVHFPSDVLAGAVCGTLAGAVPAYAFSALGLRGQRGHDAELGLQGDALR